MVPHPHIAFTGEAMYTARNVLNRDAVRPSPALQEQLTMIPSCAEVVVQREWNGWRTATARMTELEDLHWYHPEGAPRPLLHGYVSCRALTHGVLQHDCDGMTPHWLLVCVLKCHTAAPVFDNLVALAAGVHER